MHYLDWGGDGPPLLFLAGMGCSAHIFSQFAPRFTDRFHVLGLDRRGHGDSDFPDAGYDVDTLTEDLRQVLDALDVQQVILAGHSMAVVELCRFTALHRGRVLKLIFLDAAYDGSNPAQQAIWDNTPTRKMMPPWPSEAPRSIEAYADTLRRLAPSINAIWSPAVEADLPHGVRLTPEGGIVDKMSDDEANALRQTMRTYVPEWAALQGVPVLSFFCLHDGRDFISQQYMTSAQQAEVLDYFDHTRKPFTQNWIEGFRNLVPHARLVVIPNGNHYCFIKQQELVFEEMRKFLADG